MILEPKKIKSDTVSTVSPSISHEVMGPDAMILVVTEFIGKKKKYIYIHTKYIFKCENFFIRNCFMCILLCFGVDSLGRIVVVNLKPPVLKCLHTCEYITWEMQYDLCPHLHKIAMTI